MTIEQSEIRQERAASAAATARSNLPTSVFVLSLGLFAVAFIALIWCIIARQTATAKLDAQMAQANSIFRSIDEIKSLRAQIARVKDTRSNEPMTGVPLRLQQATTNPKLSAALASPGAKEVLTTGSKESGLVQKRYTVSLIQHDSIEDIMSWIEKALTDIKGLEVESIDLTPTANTWNLNITFSRWEKKEG